METNTGISFQDAISILSSRTDSESDIKENGCPCKERNEFERTKNNFPSHTTNLDLMTDEESTPHFIKESEEPQQVTEDERKRNTLKRTLKLRDELSKLGIDSLLQAFFQFQEERVSTYRNFDRELNEILEQKNIAHYPTIVTQATASFSLLSDSINNVRFILQNNYKRQDLVRWIQKLQELEKQKLTITAALHMESIRKCNETLSLQHDCGKNPAVSNLLHDGVVSLKSKVAQSVGNINEVLEELRCIVAEEFQSCH